MANKYKSRRIEWTDEQLEYMRIHYPTETAGDIADVLGCSSTTVINLAHRLGLQKSPDFKASDYVNRYVQRAGVIRKGV